MFLFGHLGITLGAALAVQGGKQYYNANLENKKAKLTTATGNDRLLVSRNKITLISVTEKLAQNIDIRFLLVGSLLPDMIDKPLGAFNLGNGRSISHTLLFLFVFTLTGILLNLWRKGTRMLLVAGGIFTHLVLDSMWLNTTVLFWPFNGSHFTTGTPSEWFGLWGHLLTHDPVVYTAEMIGLIIMLYFVYFLFKQGEFWLFIKRGYLVDVTKIKFS